ncbi:hypothetical protein TREMEDRAFT_67560 [Tremella mesenterica DSM 1558]|uniref:uncharacterized protein n=1 Tax=Tremella mesenterica (strain ATCC 24925 / CBS 8224 / DSM 1558 / NBRC 9311 / NRRL Y-6157 / RJB 2259-6 / UBC 559-6) TaxID=578456 RepID=UPI0003F49D0F|nr:uncharacterized protein TREMEDRAFT_67560 [Tremella mesenterica DSM 1558]EIW71087.1 hypothetical protein TREMEDRAFT_67560 [Tremella mesenterica DSM 1558]
MTSEMLGEQSTLGIYLQRIITHYRQGHSNCLPPPLSVSRNKTRPVEFPRREGR